MDLRDMLRQAMEHAGDNEKEVINSEIVKDPAQRAIFDTMRANRIEMHDLIAKVERIKLKNELLVKDVWDHAALLFSYDSVGALHDGDKSMTLDVDKYTVNLVGEKKED